MHLKMWGRKKELECERKDQKAPSTGFLELDQKFFFPRTLQRTSTSRFVGSTEQKIQLGLQVIHLPIHPYFSSLLGLHPPGFLSPPTHDLRPHPCKLGRRALPNMSMIQMLGKQLLNLQLLRNSQPVLAQHDIPYLLGLERVHIEDDNLCPYVLLLDLLWLKVLLSCSHSNLKCRRSKVRPGYKLYPQYCKEYLDMERSGLQALICIRLMVYLDCLLQRLFSQVLEQRTDILETLTILGCINFRLEKLQKYRPGLYLQILIHYSHLRRRKVYYLLE